MALDPGGMQAAIITNLREKTGRDLDAWLAELARHDLPQRKDRIAWLKANGVGHVTAGVIADRAVSRGAPYDDAEALLAGLFGDDGDVRRARYEQVRDTLVAALPGTKVTACKGYVGFSDGRQYAVVRASGDRIEIGLRLPPDATVLHRVRSFGGGAITSAFLTDGTVGPAELDLVRASAAR